MDTKAEGSPAEAPAAEASSSKPRMKRPVKPDVEEHKAAVEQLQNEMHKRKARVDEIKQAIDQKRNFDGGPEFQKARSKLNQLSSSFKAQLESKKTLREELNSVNKSRDNLRAQLREMKSKVGVFSTPQKIDERISALEYDITHNTIDLKQENKTRDEMKRLAGLKPLTGTYAKAQEDLKASDASRDQIMGSLKACDEKLTSIKGEEEQQRASVNEMRNKEAKNQDVPALIKERDECREVMNALWQKIQELREEHKIRHNQFWEDHKAWQQQNQEERRLKQVQREKEWAERNAERKAAAAEFAGEPYHKEVGLCEQLLSHLGKYQPQDKESPTSSAKEASTSDAAIPFEGMKAVKKPDTSDGFEAFLGNAGKKGKGKKGKASSSAPAPQDQKLNHSLDMIDAFSKLKVSMPTTSSKVPGAVKEVEERKAYWLKKRAEAKEKGFVADEEAASSSSKPKQQPNGIAKGRGPNPTLDLTTEEWPDFAGNVKAAETSTASGASQKEDNLIAVKLKVSGDGVLLTCTPLV